MKRVALITGAAGGIGRATTERFAAEGWDTIAVDRQAAGGFPPAVAFRQADVSEPRAVAELFEWVGQGWQRLDALVNNAAIQICKPMVDLSVEEWDGVMASNLRSAFLLARLVLPEMYARGSGVILNIASLAAKAAFASPTTTRWPTRCACSSTIPSWPAGRSGSICA